MNKKTNYLIVGAGIAGLTTALYLKDIGDVTIITKGKLKQANTYWAQGGISAVMTKEDHFEEHIKDTMEAGAHHNDRKAVRYLVEHAPEAIRFLKSIGVNFNEEPVLEGGHSEARIWRTSDFTGQDILNTLISAIQKVKNIEIKEGTEAVELIVKKRTCRGVFIRESGSAELKPFFARNTILATGGLGQLFAKTSNTLSAGGDGMALAANAGVKLKDIEFVQFHPTALDKHDNGRYFLLSETMRGFGAKIINSHSQQFLHEYDKRGELASRDLITRAISFEQMHGPVFLDIRHIDKKELTNRFPNIYKRLKKYGFNLTKDLIPITPIAHFACGGISVDSHGATKLSNLFAVGEVACSGVHGANRLPSNALLEGVVFAKSIAETLKKSKKMDTAINLDNLALDIPKVAIESEEQIRAYASRIQQIMWDKVGIVRTTEGLKEALREITEIPARDYRIQHRQLVCYKIIQACLDRADSLGCHYIASPQ